MQMPYNFILVFLQVNINPAYQIPEMEYALKKVTRNYWSVPCVASGVHALVLSCIFIWI